MGHFSNGMLTFYTRLYETVEDPSLDSIISWSDSNKSFIIRDQKELIRRRLLRRFYCLSFTRFLIELEKFGFVRMNSDSEQLEFGHKKYFVRGQPELLKTMHSTSVMKRLKKRSKAIKANKAKAVEQVEGRMQHNKSLSLGFQRNVQALLLWKEFVTKQGASNAN